MMHLLANSKALLLMTDRGANYKSRRIWMAFNFTVCTFFFFLIMQFASGGNTWESNM